MSDYYIEKDSTKSDSYLLFVDDGLKASVIKRPDGIVDFRWHIYGPQDLEKAKAILQGLVDLSIIGDSLT